MLLAAILTIFFFTVTPIQQAHAGDFKQIGTLPSGVDQNDWSKCLNSNFNMATNYNNCTVVPVNNDWNSLKYEWSGNGGNWRGVAIKVQNVSGTWTAWNPFRLQFDNIGTIFGRQVNATIDVNAVAVLSTSTKNDYGKGHYGYQNTGWLSVVQLWNHGGDGVSFGNNGNPYEFRVKTRIDLTTNVYYADTGETVNLPFFKCVNDLDVTKYGEGWQIGQGYTGEYWVHDRAWINVDVNQRKFSSAMAVGSFTDNADEYYVSGVYAITESGWFKESYYEGNCGTGYAITSSYTAIPDPVKYASPQDLKWQDVNNKNPTTYRPGDTINWVVESSMGTWVRDTLTYYRQLMAWEVIDTSKMDILGLRMFSGDEDISDQGWFEWVDDNHQLNTSSTDKGYVTWQANESWRTNYENYRGQKLRFVITVRLKDNASGSLRNDAAFVHEGWMDKWCNTTIQVATPINYYRDGEDTPCYVDWVTDTDSIYQTNPDAIQTAKRQNCAEFDGWYLDPELAKPYVTKNGKKPGSTGFNLYGRNTVTLTYKPTTNSYFLQNPNKKYWLDSKHTKQMTSTSQILPEKKTYYYGYNVTFNKGADLYYKDIGDRKLTSDNGAYLLPDGSGTLNESLRLDQNTTAYLRWSGGKYDGVYTK